MLQIKKIGHFKQDYPVHLKSMLENEKKEEKTDFHKVNLVTWGDEDIDFGDDEENEKEVLLCLIVNGNNSSEVYCFNDDDIDDLYNELYDSLIKARIALKLANNKIEMLNEEIRMIRIENDMLSVMTKKQLFESYYYSKCKVLEVEIWNLNKVLQGFAASKNKLTNIIGNQKDFSNKYGLGFRKH